MKKNVFAYFEQIENAGPKTHAAYRFSSESLPLLGYWKNSWSHFGFNPIIAGTNVYKDFKWRKYFNFNLSDYIENPKSKLYSKLNWNSFEYHRARYRRLVAFSSFVLDNGSSLRADYDVLNYGVTPDFLETLPANCCISPERSVVFQNEEGVQNTLSSIYEFIKNDEDQSESGDLEILQRYDTKINPFVCSRGVSFLCRDEGDWSMKYKKSLLVHFDGQSKNLKKIKETYGGRDISRVETLRCLRPTPMPNKML